MVNFSLLTLTLHSCQKESYNFVYKFASLEIARILSHTCCHLMCSSHIRCRHDVAHLGRRQNAGDDIDDGCCFSSAWGALDETDAGKNWWTENTFGGRLRHSLLRLRKEQQLFIQRRSAYIFRRYKTFRLTFLRMRDKCKFINVQRKDKAFMA